MKYEGDSLLGDELAEAVGKKEIQLIDHRYSHGWVQRRAENSIMLGYEGTAEKKREVQ